MITSSGCQARAERARVERLGDVGRRLAEGQLESDRRIDGLALAGQGELEVTRQVAAEIDDEGVVAPERFPAEVGGRRHRLHAPAQKSRGIGNRLDQRHRSADGLLQPGLERLRDADPTIAVGLRESAPRAGTTPAARGTAWSRLRLLRVDITRISW